MSEHYIPRKISEIGESDTKVVFVGTISDVKENGFVLKDDNGETEIEFVGSPEKNKMVRVFCSVSEGKLKADIIQDMDKMDMTLFKKVEELYNKAGV